MIDTIVEEYGRCPKCGEPPWEFLDPVYENGCHLECLNGHLLEYYRPNDELRYIPPVNEWPPDRIP